MASDTISNATDSPTPDIKAEYPMDTLTTQSLKALQSNDQRRVMDIVDKLRRTGLSGIVELPQLVVCGDQSSGKSSVLEAITEIPFPRKENLCTRFATEIVLRRSTTPTISITITSDKLRPKPEQQKLKMFNKVIKNFEQLPEIIEEATQAMGLGRVGENNSRAFSRDVLSVEICGPDRPQLTLVDLPGLIHTTNKAQSETDKILIFNLVKEYMTNPRTIILAVVSAKNDYANQVILNHCREIDEKGRRTLGIITKPDFLREGSENEKDWLELAQNKDIYLERGWHMLRNRADNEMGRSFKERNEAENVFFSNGRYADLPRECVGIDALRERLSKLLLNHLIRELPSLKGEMMKKMQDTMDDIKLLGEKRTTMHEQRTMLIRISMEVTDLLKLASRGYYSHSFFGRIHLNKDVDAPENIPRFRAVVQYLNTKFAENMRLRGNKFAIAPGPGDDEADASDIMKANNDLRAQTLTANFGSPAPLLLPTPKVLGRAQAVEWVQKVMERSRGNELPGGFNVTLISQLFWEQSEPWAEIARVHINDVARAVKTFVHMVVKYAAPVEFQSRLASVSVDAALAQCLKDARDELAKVVKDKARDPMTYNHYFTTTLQKYRQRKQTKITDGARRAPEEVQYHDKQRVLCDPNKLEKAMASVIELNMDIFSSEEALDSQQAYYKDEMKYFINVVTKQVIERHLVEPLPEIVLSPLVITQLSDKEVKFIAAEPPEVTQQRMNLEARAAMLEKGLETFHEAMGGVRG